MVDRIPYPPNKELTARVVLLEAQVKALMGLRRTGGRQVPSASPEKFEMLRAAVNQHAGMFNLLVSDMLWGWSDDKKKNRGAIAPVMRLRHAWFKKQGERRKMSKIGKGAR